MLIAERCEFNMPADMKECADRSSINLVGLKRDLEDNRCIQEEGFSARTALAWVCPD